MSYFLNHIESLRNDLKENSPRDYIFIIEYLINFLGCLVLSELKNATIKDLNRKQNISNLTAGEWVKLIEETLKREDNKLLSEIKKRFFDNKGKINSSIQRWIELRNIFAHDIILPGPEILKTECNKKFININEEFDNFIKSLKGVLTNINTNLNNSPFFHFKDDKIYIYSGIENDYIKYRHYSNPPLEILRAPDFPILIKEIFISLNETPDNILWGYDPIKLQIKTVTDKSYVNEFQIYINDILIKSAIETYKNGYIIEFHTKELSAGNIKFNDSNILKVVAVRKGYIQDSVQKYIKIFKEPPEPLMLWQRSETEKINIPINTERKEKIIIKSMFQISDVSLRESCYKLNKNFSLIFKEDYLEISLLSNRPSTEKIYLNMTYKDALGSSKTLNKELFVNFTPNFFEPEFVGEDRFEIINELQKITIPCLIIGEGGVGKTRLIQEFLKSIDGESITITVSPFKKLSVTLAKQLGIDLKEKKEEIVITEILDWIERHKDLNKILWFQNCHEILNKDDMQLLRILCKKNSGNKIRLIFESRDTSWHKNVQELINELVKENIKIIHLQRLKTNELIKIIDSIFFGNTFPEEFKKLLIKKSDGIIYILLQELQNLYDSKHIVYSECPDKLPCWNISGSLKEIEEIVNHFDYQKILQIGVEQALEVLDKGGLGLKARELLRYLYFYPLTFRELSRLLNLCDRDLQYLIEILKDKYIIKDFKKDEKIFYQYHHQIKRDYCKDRYLPSEMECDYFLTLAIFEIQYEKYLTLREVLKEFDNGNKEIEAENYDDFQYGSDFNKYINDGSIYKLHGPYLMEKVDYLISKSIYDNRINLVLLMKTYMQLFETDAKFFGYLSSILDYTFGGYPSRFTDEFLNDINMLIKYREVDETNPYYCAFMSRLLSYKLMDELYSSEVFNIYDEFSLYSLVLYSTEAFKNNIELLKSVYDKIDEIKFYAKLSEGVKFDEPIWVKKDKDLEIGKDLDKNDFLTDSEDYCISLIHITGILTIFDQNYYKDKYLEFLRECINEFKDKSKFKRYLIEHLNAIEEAGLDYTFLLNLIKSSEIIS